VAEWKEWGLTATRVNGDERKCTDKGQAYIDEEILGDMKSNQYHRSIRS